MDSSPAAGAAFFPLTKTNPQLPVEGQAGGAVIVPVTRRTWEPVNLGGTLYRYRAPKMLTSMSIAAAARNAGQDPTVMVDAIITWVRAAFGDDADAITARLRDDDDDLDIPDLMRLIQASMEDSDGPATVPTM